jgi:hypothetical protein
MKMNSILKAGLSAAAIALSASASATVYYVSDCQAGAAAGCVAGSDANNGTSPTTPWQTVAKASSMIGSLLAGDEIRFARGASFSNARLQIYNIRARAATPLVFDSYKPSWGTGTQKPILMAPTGAQALQFEDSGNADHDEGYVVRNLDLRGSGSSIGVFIYNDADYITLENLDISGFAIGVNCSESNAPNTGSNARNDYITLRSSNIHDNKDIGYLGGCTNVLVENNRFDNNGFGGGTMINRNHNIYISTEGTNVVVRGNTLTRSAVTGGACGGVPIVAHGKQAGLVIENNVIDESTGAAPGCYGIQVNPGYGSIAESFTGAVIRGNKVINPGTIGIAVGSCPSCVIENNFVIKETSGLFVGIAMPSENIEAGVDAADTNLTVRNNSIYVTSPAYGSQGIRTETYGGTHKVVSNMVFFGPTASGVACFSTKGLTLASFTAYDNNLCYSTGSVAYSATYATLAAAQAAGFDRNGMFKDPQLLAAPSAANGYSMKAADTSPLLKTGNTLYSVVTGTSNIGAYDRTPPSPPPTVSIK